ncbi:hypothetical protein K9O30_01870 [Clostridium bowmanii]|uniref:hypothetical protein n=1 Tax=Clostridium bowmanii TaxID=132925 RepID=UPI001C0AFE2E|nr:hypothetical protein [Clostridium bowmanii]MBU3190282.1 hypothetical protein [Clostridium bowmanii]MCA1072506.1 hypothetical protein [Clostridium bowmanii]
MINKKIFRGFSKFVIATIIMSSLSVVAYAKDEDIWKDNANLGGIDNIILHCSLNLVIYSVSILI